MVVVARSAGALCAAGFARPAVIRVLLIAGLALVGWVLAAVLGSPASAEELPGGSGAAETQQATESPEPLSQVRHVVREVTQPQAGASTQAEPETASAPKRTGGLLGPVSSTVTNVVGTVTNTVNGTVGGLTRTVDGVVGGTVGTVGGVVDGTVGTVTPILEKPGTLLPAPENSDGVVTTPPVANTPAPAQADAVPPAPRPAPAPPKKPAEPAVAEVTAPATGKPAKAPVTWSAIVPANADTHVRGGSSGGGGGPVPAAPVGCASASTSVSAPHASASGSRSMHGVLNWAPTLTQLRLIGGSRDHGADGAGREAALPATSPD